MELHDARRAEEESGQVRWLRPEFQEDRFAPEEPDAPEMELEGEEEEEPLPEWPADSIRQIAAVKQALMEAPGTVADISDRFRGASQNQAERHLEALVILGEARQSDDDRYHSVEEPAVV